MIHGGIYALQQWLECSREKSACEIANRNSYYFAMLFKYDNALTLPTLNSSYGNTPAFATDRPMCLRILLEESERHLIGTTILLRLFGHAEATTFEHDTRDLSVKNQRTNGTELLRWAQRLPISGFESWITLPAATSLIDDVDIPSSFRASGVSSKTGPGSSCNILPARPTVFKVSYWLQVVRNTDFSATSELFQELRLISQPSDTLQARPQVGLTQTTLQLPEPKLRIRRLVQRAQTQQHQYQLWMPVCAELVFNEQSDAGLLRIPMILCGERDELPATAPTVHVRWIISACTELEGDIYLPGLGSGSCSIDNSMVAQGKNTIYFNNDGGGKASGTLIVAVKYLEELVPTSATQGIDRYYRLRSWITVEWRAKRICYRQRGDHDMDLKIVYNHGQPPCYGELPSPPQYAEDRS